MIEATSTHRVVSALLTLSLLLTGCAQTRVLPDTDESCGLQLQNLHRAAVERGINDVQAQPVGKYPYLRMDRLLWSLLPALETEAQREEWGRLSMQSGVDALLADHANLASNASLPAMIGCVERQAKELASRGDYLARLGMDPYPQEYLSGYRILGLYPLSRQLMLSQLMPLQDELRQRYRSGAEEPVRTFAPPQSLPLGADEIAVWLAEASDRSALGVPYLDAQRQSRLLAHFAPVWEIETLGNHDLPGVPGWSEEVVSVDTRQPVTFEQISYTRWRGRLLLQLSYTLWFDQRPSRNPPDIYAGRLDGLILRLTLDPVGRPLLLDSIHPCGCYHTVIPLDVNLTLRSAEILGEPPLLLPRPSGIWVSGTRLHVAISSGDHMLIGLRWGGERVADETYTLRALDTLRSVTSQSSPRSLYSPPYGLIDGTERLERLLLWPSGIVSPGAMRQWGRHAIAFSAKRHFDDPDLLEMLFDG